MASVGRRYEEKFAVSLIQKPHHRVESSRFYKICFIDEQEIEVLPPETLQKQTSNKRSHSTDMIHSPARRNGSTCLSSDIEAIILR